MAKAPAQKSISITVAIDLAGPTLFGDWIGRLAAKEIETLKAFGPRRVAGLPDMIDPCPLKHVPRLNRAMGKYARMNLQRNKVLDWIFCEELATEDLIYSENGSGFSCDRTAVLAAVRAKSKATRLDGVRNKRGRPYTRTPWIVNAMIDDLRNGKMTADSPRGPTGEYLKVRFGASRRICVDAWKVARSEHIKRNPSN